MRTIQSLATIPEPQYREEKVYWEGSWILGSQNAVDQSLAPGQVEYPNLPALLIQDCFIDCNAFSIWLDGTSPSGQLTFGGVDTNKFYGPLETFPIIQQASTTSYIFANISLNGITLSSSNGESYTIKCSSFPIPIDAGASSLWLPRSVAYSIFALLGGDYDGNVAWVDPSLASNSSTPNFTFGTTAISVPTSELVHDWNAIASYLELLPVDDLAYAVVGVVFLKNAYVVYSWQHLQLSLAPANYQGKTGNVTVIPAQGIGFLNLVGTVPTTSPPPSPASMPSRTPTHPTPSSSPSSSSPPNGGLLTNGKMGIGVGAGVGGLVLLASV